MDSNDKKIGIALSGGGIRATIFHLGVLKWMAENSLLEKITYISSVSGASMCVGLIYSCNDLKWPDSHQYLTRVLPKIEDTIMGGDIQRSALMRIFPFHLTRKVNLLANVMEKKWGIHGTMSDLEAVPNWCINCTTYETGKRFHITKEKMGDYIVGYTKQHQFPLSDAMAASAGFPFLIGPYKLQRSKYTWSPSEYELKDTSIHHGAYYHLWDGGVYDNLGLEPLFKLSDGEAGGHLSEEINYIIVSNAGVTSGYKTHIGTSNPKRLLDITMEQVNSLRSRSIVNYINHEKNGLFFNIDTHADYILKKSNLSDEEKKRIVKECLAPHQASFVKAYSTTLSTPTSENFRLILRHGYEVAKCTHLAYEV